MTSGTDADTTGPGAPTLVGDRYELGPVIGYGGMAEVHRGVDTRLGRTVAIKLLRASLAQDETFQERFRREATASASLNHPCIISVYDTGDGVTSTGPARGLPYIVMEYVEGRTLRDVLREGRRILPERALEVTAGTLSALDYSHRMGIVHRDIKPANVMLTPSGEVKVMDFGIARAVEDTSTSVTQTAAVIGTAQYLSPEQARGELVGPGGDIYSVGVVLYELLVGRPPFTGSSPVALALAHVRDIPEAPAVVDPEIPAAASAIAMCALAKSPGDRYPGALAMREDIERALAGRAVWAASTPAGRAGTGGDGPRGPGPADWPVAVPVAVPVTGGADDPTGYVGSGGGWAPVGDVEETGYTGPPTRVAAGAVPGAGGVAGAGVPGAGAVPGSAAGALVGPRAAGPGDPPRRRGPLVAVLAVLVALLIAAATVGAYKLVPGPREVPVPSGPVPSGPVPTGAVGRPTTATTSTTRPTRSVTPSASPSASPSATTSASPTAAVVNVPDTTGKTVEEATRQVVAAGLRVGVRADRADAGVGKGRVISQSPGAGATAAPGDSVDLVVSTGPGQVTIGDVSGQQLPAATSRLQAAGLQVTPVEVPSSQQAGVVLETDPAAGRTVDAGSTVTVRYASGRNQVPDTTGEQSAGATTTLRGAGFIVSVQYRASSTGTPGTVVDQSPRSGSAPVGSRVVLYVTTTPSPSPTPTPAPSSSSSSTSSPSGSPSPTPSPAAMTTTPAATATPSPRGATSTR